MDIQSPSVPLHSAWLRLGFRPFFLAAGGFAVVVMVLWFASFTLDVSFPFAGLVPMSWHGHEMIYGYGMAVIAGFLLTAVRNWTGIQTLRGTPLLLLFLFWLTARLALLLGNSHWLPLAASFDLLFLALLSTAVAVPILRAHHWHSLAIVAKLLLLLGANLVFYLGAAGRIESGIYWGLYSGLYLIIALIFTMARRVLPFFIERGVGYPVELYNNKWIDISSLVLLAVFWIADMVRPNGLLVTLLALALFVLHLRRLVGWYTPGIWSKPLLWVLYLAYAAIVVAFGLKALVYFAGISSYFALHAFAVGGIGMMTLGMMARVALGHSGRNVFEPPPQLFWIFSILFLSFVLRVFAPMLFVEAYRLWIGLSQALWTAAFAAFFFMYFPILSQPRIDGQDG
ncbi:MAG TPA: NnrS family protein [Gammaproteobacteria bacterium]|nr:NnrS family protein [Gammaproteobacteria bacterium]